MMKYFNSSWKFYFKTFISHKEKWGYWWLISLRPEIRPKNLKMDKNTNKVTTNFIYDKEIWKDLLINS